MQRLLLACGMSTGPTVSRHGCGARAALLPLRRASHYDERLSPEAMP